MRVLLINICLRPYLKRISPPVGLGFIATAIDRAGFDLKIIDIDAHRYSDAELKKILQTEEYDVAAFGCIVTGYKTVKKLAKMIKNCKSVPIIAGNSVATSIPELLLTKTKVDIAVIGEGDVTIVELLQTLDNNQPLENVDGIVFKQNDQITSTPPRTPLPNLDEIPFINWELFDVDIYLSKSKENIPKPYPIEYDSIKAMPVNTARGCPYNCTFCYHVFKKYKFRVRSSKNILKEIRFLKEKYDVNFIQFWDELTFYSKKQLTTFLDLLLDENLEIHWAAPTRSNLLNKDDLEIALKIKEAGCVGLGFSLESANHEILKAMNKGLTPEDFLTQTKVLQAAGIPTFTSLVIGYPQENEQSLKETFDCCYEAGVYPSAGYLLPQPGTPIYDYAVTTGKIKDEEKYLLTIGDRQDFSINLTQMEKNKIESLVKKHLLKISKKLNLDLNEETIIKTDVYRSKIQKDKKKNVQEERALTST